MDTTNIVFVFILIRVGLSLNSNDDETYPVLIFSDTHSIGLFDTKSDNVTILADGYAYILFLDSHYSKQYIFWSDYHGNTISRFQYPTEDRSTPEVIINVNKPTGVAIDPIDDHLYWAVKSNQIFRSNFDGTDSTIIVNNVNFPLDVDLDISNRLMFFVTASREIWKCNLNGSECNVVVDSTKIMFTSEHIALDFYDDRIFWTYIHQYSPISSTLFDGTDYRETLASAYQGYGLDFSATHIYYADWFKGIYKIKKANSTTSSLLYGSVVSAMKIFKSEDECFTYKLIEKQEERSADFETEMSNYIPISDENLEEAWYRIKSENGDQIPTYPPGAFHCGTNYPVWMNGTFPIVSDGNLTVAACLQTENSTCETSFNVQIRNCGNYFIYFLQNTTKNAAYCFGNGPVLCQDGLSSESGYYPGCSSSFPTEIVTPYVNASLTQGQSETGSSSGLVPIFECKFDDIPNGTYVYDIFWFINGINVTEHKNIPFDNLESTVLKDSEWTNIFTMNMEVTCSVRLRFIARSVPSPFHRSKIFYAGLYPEKYEYTVIEGESVDIAFTQTVPVACFTSNHGFQKKFCTKDVYTFQPPKNGPVCSNNIANRDIVFNAEFCGIKLESLDWENTKYLRVYGFSDGIYNHQDRSTYIRLSTNTISAFHDIWTNLSLSEIKVNVLDKDSTMTGRLCQVYNDPHFRTFDGKVYHYMEVGEFVLYRNSKGPYWVHSLFTNCGFGWKGSSCLCGVAIRSRNSLFVLRTCERVSRDSSFPLNSPHSEVRICDGNDLSIDISHNTYTITLPTGTEIKFTISTWSMLINSVSIKPSIFDINEAKGLCGVPSLVKDTSDDFTHRDSGSVSDERSFADSWRITAIHTPDEQLFIEEPTFLSLDVGIVIDNVNNTNDNATDRYCVCESQAPRYNGDLDLYNTVQCNLTESTETCSSAGQTGVNADLIGSFVTSCITTGYSRKKRSINTGHKIVRRSTSDTDDVLDVKPLEYDDDVNSSTNFTRSFRNGWTEEKANQTCYELIKDQIPTDLQENGIILSEEEYIESCVEDIKLTADTTFAKDTVSAMQTYTLMEVLRNETMAIAEKDNSTQTVLEYITSLLCPNNCSGNGNCTQGFCTCTKEYAGDDCSQQIYIPPANISLPTAGLCGTRTRACQRTNIYGYFPSRDVWCNKTHFQVNGDSKTYADPVMVKADYRTAFMVSVALSGTRKKRSTLNTGMAEGYELRLSNDGIEFSDPVIIIIYDEECYDCNASSISCVIVASCPDFTTTGMDTTSDRVSTIEETTTQDTTTIEETTTQDTTTIEETTTQDTTTIKETTTQDTTTVEETTTQNTTTSEETTTQDTTTIEETTSQDTTTQQLTTTDFMTITRQLTTTIQQTTSDSLTTNNQLPHTSHQDSTPYDTATRDKTTTHKDTTQEDADELISYIGPIIIGGSVLLFIVIFCAILLIKSILKTSKPRNQSITQFDSWNIYTGGTSGGSNNKQVNSRPDFRNVPRINTRSSESSMTSNTDGQRNFFNDYYQQ
ncbi:von Willebrand factor D and EGF domain-containing protein-like isoform X2 [Mytilus californianus]|uniref:von Willebrand factor D and EGF domain-containing protein-like isoform X2 n=1 Tax=Mytilus californianus TaxID=6549 RepID=UPI002245DCEA|nr:von Willebrand factor D and EGF domain-containing protein-like isoform X2 [Mytilus californianus]